MPDIPQANKLDFFGICQFSQTLSGRQKGIGEEQSGDECDEKH
jgi:hypothetical protein